MQGRLTPTAPQVSVVIPTYNRAAVLAHAIRSVINQTLSDLECIVADDGSTDQTVALVEGIQDLRLRLIRLSCNRGVGHTRNVGIRAVRGELIAFLDSDDEWLPQALERQVRRMRESADPRVTVIYCLYYEHDGVTDRLTPHGTLIYEGEVFEHLLTGWHPPTAGSGLSRIHERTLERLPAGGCPCSAPGLSYARAVTASSIASRSAHTSVSAKSISVLGCDMSVAHS